MHDLPFVCNLFNLRGISLCSPFDFPTSFPKASPLCKLLRLYLLGKKEDQLRKLVRGELEEPKLAGSR